MVSSVPNQSVSSCSRVLWMSWVPHMNRTDAMPKPCSVSPSETARSISGLSARPR